MGSLAADGSQRDYPVLQAVISTVIMIVLVNLLVDLAYVALDPRIGWRGDEGISDLEPALGAGLIIIGGIALFAPLLFFDGGSKMDLTARLMPAFQDPAHFRHRRRARPGAHAHGGRVSFVGDRQRAR